MPISTKSLVINASPEQIFQKVDDPTAAPTLFPNVSKVYDIQRSDKKIGDTFTVSYSMMGMHMDEKFTYTEHAPSKRLVAKFEGPMTGVMALDLEPQEGKTKATITVDYHLGGGFLGKIANRLLFERMNDKNTERTLENIKIYSESG